MLRLRPYKLSDGEYLLNWINDELIFSKWCADKFTYPLTKEQLEEYYHNYEKENSGFIITAIDGEGKPVGHFLMRLADYEDNSVHIGFVIIDKEKRGQGYGREMISLAVKYAFEILKMKRVTLGVFDNNEVAHRCYKSVGFVDEKYCKDVFRYKDENWGIYEMAIERI